MQELEKYYQILELNSQATIVEIKQAYRQLAKKWHPDNFHDDQQNQTLAQQKFIEINQAYEILISQNQGKNNIPNNSNSETKVKSEVNTADLYYRLGVEAAEKDQLTEAVNYFSQAIKIDANFRDAYFYRGIVLEKQGFNLRAESDFDRFKILQAIELTNIWKQVINHLQFTISQELAQQYLQLVSLNDTVAVIALTNQFLLSRVEKQKSDLEQAFKQVCDRQITVKFEQQKPKHNHVRNRQSSSKKKYSRQPKNPITTGQLIIGFFASIFILTFLVNLSQRINQKDNNNKISTVIMSPKIINHISPQ